jgi:hypothetical protein
MPQRSCTVKVTTSALAAASTLSLVGTANFIGAAGEFFFDRTTGFVEGRVEACRLRAASSGRCSVDYALLLNGTAILTLDGLGFGNSMATVFVSSDRSSTCFSSRRYFFRPSSFSIAASLFFPCIRTAPSP